MRYYRMSILYKFFALAVFLTLADLTAQPLRTPKNIIFLVTDGWGYNHIAATNFYQHGVANAQAYQKFPVRYGMSTYSSGGSYDPAKAWRDFEYLKLKAADSAASATALSTGVKTYKDAIGVDRNRRRLETVVERAEKNGKSTGLVTNVMVSHATPAAMVAHNRSRRNYEEIIREMIYRSGLDVLMGCGHPGYDNDGRKLSSPSNFRYVGSRSIWEDLIAGRAGSPVKWTLIQDVSEFRKMMTGPTPKRVIGIPKVFRTLQQKRSGRTLRRNTTDLPYTDKQVATVPSLAEMSKAALNVLDNNRKGFFLMIESGAIDWCGHSNSTARLIEEMIDFNNTVNAVINWVTRNSNWNETLVIVTGDHETGYLNGPGSGPGNPPRWNKIKNNGKGKLPGTQWDSRGHTNQLIPFFAKGAGSERFHAYAKKRDRVRGKYIDNTTTGLVFKAIYQNIPFAVSGEEVAHPPGQFELSSNFPSPFTPSTQIKFTLPQSGKVQLSVYDLQGRKVATLVNKVKSAGIHQVNWNTVNFSSGIYFYVLNSGGQKRIKQMMLLK